MLQQCVVNASHSQLQLCVLGEQKSIGTEHLHRYRRTVSSESLWIHSIRSTFRICVCKYPRKQLLIPL